MSMDFARFWDIFVLFILDIASRSGLEKTLLVNSWPQSINTMSQVLLSICDFHFLVHISCYFLLRLLQPVRIFVLSLFYPPPPQVYTLHTNGGTKRRYVYINA